MIIGYSLSNNSDFVLSVVELIEDGTVVMEMSFFVRVGKMMRCSRRLVFLLVSLLLIWGLAGCLWRRAASQEPVWQPGSDWLVPQQILRDAELERVWETKLPIKRTETLERLFIFGDRLYALSDQSFLVCLDRQTGRVVFSRSVGQVGFPVVGLEVYRQQLFSVIGARLVEIDAGSGTQRSAVPLGYDVSCPAARNASFFYIGGADRRLHTLRADDKVQVFEAAAQNDSMISSIIADEKFVVFATDGGNCISIKPDRAKLLWQFDAQGAIVRPIARDTYSLYFACEDTNLYKLNIFTGGFVWKYQAGAMLERGPRIGERIVYQYAHNRGLAAIDKDSGAVLWRLAGGLDLVTEAGAKAYVITTDGDLVVVDNDKAKQLYKVDLSGVSKYAVNTTDSKIYIAGEDGRIACLEPTE